MKKLNQQGQFSALLISFILVIMLFLGAASFGVWAFMQRQDYKLHSDKKAAEAATVAVTATEKNDAAKFDEESKNPFDTYIGPAAFGNITVKYPKTWSAYVRETKSGDTPVDAYFQPSFVPDTQDANNNFALRVSLSQSSYDQVLEELSSTIKEGKATAAPYALPKVPSVVGSRVEGQISSTKQGTMIVLPLRNMTLEIWTESNTFKPDLDKNILPNITFAP
jgi:flagellar basal body-associated protein FliL